MRTIIDLTALFTILLAAGCAGTRIKLDQGGQNYGLSTAELAVLDTMDRALDKLDEKLDEEGIPAGKTASLQILGVYSPSFLHDYVRRLVEARLANRGLTIVKEKKLVPAGGRFYKDGDFEYWSQDTRAKGKTGEGAELTQRLLSGAMTALAPEEGNLPDLRIVLAFRTAGVDVLVKDYMIFREDAFTCRVDAKLCVFGDSLVKSYEGKAESKPYIYKRRLLWLIPLPAPYKELNTDRRSFLRKLLDGLFGSGQATQVVLVPPGGGGA